ncbi:MAG: DUF4102 domain-containing protein [Desulfovibrio sp.]|nr:DUF4102 domain-containing protein [Desulfovibrio sp.]
MPLNDTMLRNLKSDGTPTKLADSEGFSLYLSASGGKTLANGLPFWRQVKDAQFRRGSRRLPERSPDEARQGQGLLADDIDPGAQKKAAGEEAEAAAREQAPPLIVMAGEWFACYISLGRRTWAFLCCNRSPGPPDACIFPESDG